MDHVLISRPQHRDERVRQQKRRRRPHAHAARYIGDKVVAVVSENAPGVAVRTEASDDGPEPAIPLGGEWQTKAAGDFVAEGILLWSS